MDEVLDADISDAIADLEKMLARVGAESEMSVRRTVLMILLRNGLIAASRLQMDGELRSMVEASRALEQQPQVH